MRALILMLVVAGLAQLVRGARAWSLAQSALLPEHAWMGRAANPEHYTAEGREWRRRAFRYWMASMLIFVLCALVASAWD